MTILGFLFLAFLFYLGFRLVFDFILPIYRTTKRVRKGFREMSARMNQTEEQERTNHTEQFRQRPSGQNNNHKGGVGEYIDFEEIKD